MVEVITVKNNHVDHYKTVIMHYQVLCKKKVGCVLLISCNVLIC